MHCLRETRKRYAELCEWACFHTPKRGREEQTRWSSFALWSTGAVGKGVSARVWICWAQ